jgi:hypothetical protein
VGTLPPDDVTVFNLTASQPASATLREWPLRPSKPPTTLHRLSYGRGRVLNDAQSASIKGRLQLTPEQERMWPAVEAALRKISYTKDAVAQNRSIQDGVAGASPVIATLLKSSSGTRSTQLRVSIRCR